DFAIPAACQFPPDDLLFLDQRSYIFANAGALVQPQLWAEIVLKTRGTHFGDQLWRPRSVFPLFSRLPAIFGENSQSNIGLWSRIGFHQPGTREPAPATGCSYSIITEPGTDRRMKIAVLPGYGRR